MVQGATGVVPARGPRTKRTRRAKTKTTPAARLAMLESDEAKARLPEKFRQAEMRRIALELGRLKNSVPSANWLDEVQHHGVEFPPGRNDPPAPHGIRMVLSRIGVRHGDGVARCRYTPPNAVGLEDLLDAMTPLEAEFPLVPHPVSVSAKAIQDIAAVGARPLGGKW